MQSCNNFPWRKVILIVEWSPNFFCFLLLLRSWGILIPLTPGYVVSISSFPVPSGLRGEIFCRFLGSRYVLFTMGRVSILKVTCLAVERWFSIFRPMTYRFYFTTKRMFLYILAIWVFTCILKSNKFFEWKLLGNKCSPIKAPYGETITQTIVIFINSVIGFCLPCIITWASFAHIALLFKTSLVARCYGERQKKQQKALLRMCAVACLTLTLCWLPAQAIYVLSPFGITNIDSPIHIIGGILAMSNSCVNPLIYWMTNKEYRDSLCKTFEVSKIKLFNRRRKKMMESQMYELMVLRNSGNWGDTLFRSSSWTRCVFLDCKIVWYKLLKCSNSLPLKQ